MSDTVEMKTWLYRRIEVSEDEIIIDIPKKARCISVRPLSKKSTSLIEWLEPVQEGEQ